MSQSSVLVCVAQESVIDNCHLSRGFLFLFEQRKRELKNFSELEEEEEKTKRRREKLLEFGFVTDFETGRARAARTRRGRRGEARRGGIRKRRSLSLSLFQCVCVLCIQLFHHQEERERERS